MSALVAQVYMTIDVTVAVGGTATTAFALSDSRTSLVASNFS